MDVSELTPGDIGKWDEYVSNAQDGHPFQLSGWRAVMQECYGYPSWYLVVLDGGQIVGVLPLFKIASKLVGTSITSLPRGICVEESEGARALLERAKDITRAAGAASLIIRDCLHCWGDEPGWYDDCSVSVRELPNDLEVLQKQLKRQLRQHIHKAEAFGVQTAAGTEYVDEFYDTFCDLLHEKGVPVFSSAFLQAVVKELPGRFVITTARLNGKVIGAIFHLTLRDTMFAVWGGAPSCYREYRPSHALWWESMRYAVDNGYRYLDMGRNLRGSGSETFKERWGSITQPIYRLRFSEDSRAVYDPLEGARSNLRYRVFTQAWRRLPYPVVRFLGPRLRRHMPFG